MNNHAFGLPAERIPVLRVVATPADTNSNGGIFGGWVMAQIDIAGSIPAVLRAQGRVVTAAVNFMTFLRPVMVGDVVSIYGDIDKVGRTSLTVGLEVYAQRNHEDLETLRVAEANLSYVAVDGNGRPSPIDQSPVDHAL